MVNNEQELKLFYQHEPKNVLPTKVRLDNFENFWRIKARDHEGLIMNI